MLRAPHGMAAARSTCYQFSYARHKPFTRCHRKISHRSLIAASPPRKQSEAEETTEKYGLEAGLFKIFTNKKQGAKAGRGEQAKQLLAQYGSAYLLTSVSFAIVSFGLCYALVSAGVDVGSLLSRVGLQVNDTSEKVGTVAIAYAAHKALSPVRFPPTVALTPVVASWLGKRTGNKDVDHALDEVTEAAKEDIRNSSTGNSTTDESKR